jgi:hypothetical protein
LPSQVKFKKRKIEHLGATPGVYNTLTDRVARTAQLHSSSISDETELRGTLTRTFRGDGRDKWRDPGIYQISIKCWIRLRGD